MLTKEQIEQAGRTAHRIHDLWLGVARADDTAPSARAVYVEEAVAFRNVMDALAAYERVMALRATMQESLNRMRSKGLDADLYTIQATCEWFSALDRALEG